MAPKNQLNLPPSLLAKETQAGESRANHTPDQAARPNSTQDADATASELFDEALKAARIETAEVAYLLGVSESVVRRMRSKDSRERVSFAQLLRLPPSFHWALHKAMNRRFGFGQQALRDLLDTLGLIAVNQ